MDTNNYKQGELNGYFHSVYGVEVHGTCGFVASTTEIEYYTRKKLAETLYHKDFKIIFSTMVNLGFGSGGYHNTNTSKSKKSSSKESLGISPKNLAPLFTKYYKMHSKNNIKGEYSTSSMKSIINNYIKNQKPVLGSFKAPNGDGHFMAIAGYYDITVQYKNNKRDKKYSTETTRYYVVNDGYNLATGSKGGRIQYINEKYLKTIVKLNG